MKTGRFDVGVIAISRKVGIGQKPRRMSLLDRLEMSAR